ncbi:MAG: hypothetical protein ABI863_09840 [Ginsengibacter sp.]
MLINDLAERGWRNVADLRVSFLRYDQYLEEFSDILKRGRHQVDI